LHAFYEGFAICVDFCVYPGVLTVVGLSGSANPNGSEVDWESRGDIAQGKMCVFEVRKSLSRELSFQHFWIRERVTTCIEDFLLRELSFEHFRENSL